MDATSTGATRQGSFVLERPAIELAVFEVRFDGARSTVDMPEGLALRDAIRAAGVAVSGQVAPVVKNDWTVNVGPSAPSQENIQTHGIQLTDDERGLVVTLMPQSLAVQTTIYQRWSESFRPVIAAALAGAAEVVRPKIQTRIGLRYVNRFRDPGAREASAWGRRFAAPLADVLTAGPFVGHVSSAQQQLELKLNDDVNATLRHGCFRDASVALAYSYLLDIDVYRTSTELFVAEEAVGVAEELNREAAEMFRSALNPRYAAELGFHSVATRAQGAEA